MNVYNVTSHGIEYDGFAHGDIIDRMIRQKKIKIDQEALEAVRRPPFYFQIGSNGLFKEKQKYDGRKLVIA